VRKKSAVHEAACTKLTEVEKQSLLNHFALVASIAGDLKRIGEAQDEEGSTYEWRICFSPRQRNAVIVEIFQSINPQSAMVRTFYLDDLRATWSLDSTYCRTLIDLYSQALHIADREPGDTSIVRYFARAVDENRRIH
jgi:hypothetical protein